MSKQYHKEKSGMFLATPNRSRLHVRHGYPGKQTGVVLFITLIALVAMTLAAIALVRSVDTGNAVAGNLAFKQGATAASDISIETAITALAKFADQSASYNDDSANGFYATSQDNLDMTGSKNNATMARVDWDRNNCTGTTQSACILPYPLLPQQLDNGYSARYIIHRLCAAVGDPGTTSCATYISPAVAATGGAHGAISQGGGKLTAPPVTYYRITTRVTGPRNTTSFIETTVHF